MGSLKSLTDSDIITFGKYKGSPLSEVPANYFDWLIGQSWFLSYVQLYNYIIDNKHVLDKELENETDLPW